MPLTNGCWRTGPVARERARRTDPPAIGRCPGLTRYIFDSYEPLSHRGQSPISCLTHHALTGKAAIAEREGYRLFHE